MTKATATIAILLGLTLGAAYLVAKKRKNTQRGAMMALLALLAFGPTAWAQNSWEEVYALTQTTSANWTALNAGSTTGQTLGSVDNTTYYYANSNLGFTNSNAGGSGLKIQGTVYLYVPEGVTLTCTGANASGQTGAGAGIELASGNTLYLLGGGTVNATGGNAANGGSGGTGGDATGSNGDWTQTGAGGTGGTGGGGAGAGIGTRGGAGGNGGSGGAGYRYADGAQDDAQNGTDGSAGSAGSTAGAMGNLYWLQSFVHMTATGGSQGTSGGSGGQRGRGYAYDGYSYNVSVAGGGGGGGGGFGGAASNIGTGGPGGGGGGGGAGGAQDWKPNSTGGFYDVTAYGGKGGQNANGEYAADGTEAATNGTANNQGWVTVENGSANSWYPAGGACTFGNGGSGGGKGGNTTAGTTNYTIYSDVEVSSRINVYGTMVLNLGEDATLHAPKGINVSIGNSLIINGPGTLTIDGCDSGNAGIGAKNVGTLTINGGIINVRGGENGAGIGGNAFNDGGGTITINGGIVNANGGDCAAGIGGGICGGTYNDGHGTGMCGNVYIYGGQVTAVGGSLAAGIGPGVFTSIICYQLPISGNLTIGWTNPEDFLYSSGFYSQNGSHYNETLNDISFVEGKQFIIEGLGEIADPSLPTNFGSRKILPLVDQATALPGSGSLCDPYRISNLSDWMKLAVNVNGGTKNYSGEYVRLENDLSVSIMVGKDETNSFQGTFLGNNKTLTFSYSTWEENTAPFRVTNNATIKDLKVAGSISTSAKFAAGLASRTFGTTSITNCQVDTYIHSNINGDGTHGGIVAMPSGTLNIEGCAFTGRLLTNNGTHSCGGFVGWHNSSTISVINSLYAPSSSIPSGWSAITGGATFVRGGSPTINNYCYYTEKLGDVQGSLVLVYPSDPGNLGNVVQAYSTLTAYTNGIFCDGIYYLKAATFSGAGNEGSPYLISNEFEWKSFAAYVNSGSNTYSGKYMKLTADISVTEMVGSSEGNSFQGTFLGNGNTITASIISTTTGEGANEQGVAPFHYINNATIKDLTVAGSIASASYHTSGIVGFANGTNTIEGCVVTATLNISSDYAGGIIGHGLNSNTTIRGCVFAGTINSVDGSRNNIGGIWGWSTSGTPTLLNCLENGTYTNIASMHPMGLQGGSGTITNCYYVNPQVGSPKNACTVSGAVQALTDEEIQPLGEPVATYSTSGINVYANGISYGGNFYYHPDKNIKLTVQGYGNSTESDHWAFIASPVAGSIGATAVSNLEADNAADFDLYRFNPSADLEWENWKQEGNHHHFNLENGQGYLYATKETKTLVFSGMFNTGDTKTIESLPAGFNLVGNPFTTDAYIDKPYYTLNDDGSVIVAQPNGTTTPIAPCHGVIVEVNGNESVTFSKTAPAATANQGMLNITVAEQKSDTRGASTGSATAIDNAIVRFGEGEQLGKFHFGNPSANISIPQGGKEYAVANVNVGTDVARNVSTNEMPVNFKASKNGEYTISFNPENVEFDYLHLIDNLTGSDVDLLALRQAQGPASYTFTAKTTDYASRFRLVFSASGDACEPSGNFAFISNGNIIVNGNGTLQMIDMMGRVIRSTDVARNVCTSGISAGVYVLRLIEGENVRTQKLVIE